MSGDEKQKPRLGGVKQVEQQLYAKNNKVKAYRRFGFRPEEEATINHTWEEPAAEQPTIELLEKKQTTRKKMTSFTKLLLSSVGFFLFSGLAAVLVFVLNTNEVDYDAVQLSVLGPNTIAGGEVLSFDVSVGNSNPVDVVLSDIVVNYPTGTIDAEGEGLPLEKDIVSIEEIRSGLSETVKFRAVLFGSQGETKDINISFQYRVPDSDIIFFKERVYTIGLESAPVVIRSSHDNRFRSGDDVTIGIDVVSNAQQPLQNLLLSIDYPFGFEFASSSPTGVDDSSFVIPLLGPGETYHIDIAGTILGQDGETRTIRYTLGSEDKTRPGSLGTIFTSHESALLVTKPSIGLVLEANGNRQSVVTVVPGQRINFELEFANNLDTKLLDNSITMTLSGSGYDRRSVDANDGYYRSLDDTISWDRTDVAMLGELEPTERGTVKFSLEALDSRDMAGLLQNPEMRLDVAIEATNFEIGGGEKRVSHQITQRIKVATEPTVGAELLHSEGPLENTGPLQPQVGSITTYTLALEASNTTNLITDAVVSFVLPRYVTLREMMQPQDAQIEYDERSRTVSWQIDEIQPGAGYTQSAPVVYLSLAFEPSLDQVNSVPAIVENITMTGVDQFIDASVSDRHSILGTDLDNDPDYSFGMGRVRE